MAMLHSHCYKRYLRSSFLADGVDREFFDPFELLLYVEQTGWRHTFREECAALRYRQTTATFLIHYCCSHRQWYIASLDQRAKLRQDCSRCGSRDSARA